MLKHGFYVNENTFLDEAMKEHIMLGQKSIQIYIIK